MLRSFLVGAFAALSLSCSSTPASTDIAPMLTDMASTVIAPRVAAFETSTGDLVARAGDYAATGDASSLAALQASWRASRVAWKRLDAFRFGPIDAKDVPAAIDFSPASPDAITRALTANDVSDGAIEALGGSARGFFAMELLIFDMLQGQSAAEAPKMRRDFVWALARHIQKKAREVNAAWGAGEHFADDVAKAGKGSATFPSQQSAVAQLVNQSLYAIELVYDAKLGRPLGKRSGKGVDPEAEETRRSDNTIAEASAMWESVEQTFRGSGGNLGVSSVLRAKNPELAIRLETQLDDGKVKLAALRTPFATAVAQDTASVEAAYQSTKLVKTTVSVEVASTLGITLTFNTNDGD